LPEYITLSKPTTSFLKEKNSKFYGFAYPVQDKTEIDVILKGLKSEHTEASHHCYAFSLGLNGSDYRYSDDGEPSNSAGSPIYRQILSSNSVNIFVVVVRYYGGKKLGVSGLIDAYGQAAKECLLPEFLITKRPKTWVHIRSKPNFGYKFYQLASQMKWEIYSAIEGDPDLFKVLIDDDNIQEVEKMLKELQYFELSSL